MPKTRQSERARSATMMPHREHSIPKQIDETDPNSCPKSPSPGLDDVTIRSPSQPTHFHDPAAMETITSRPKVLIKTIADLTFLHLDEKIQLPNIVVTGDQSAGKSSLVEGITGIKMPRDVGTCTRCPVHVSLSESEEGATWDCSISIEKSYTYNPDVQAGEFDITGLGAWIETEKETILFQKLQDPNDVEAALRRAQEAVLHSTATRTTRILEFSPNVIRLDIAGPGLPDLSFFDLPGVIATHKSGDAKLPDLVRALAMKYLQQDANIVLLAIPMGNDIETCQARALVNRANAQGRTIGVLTKPDMMSLGDSWLSILNGVDHPLGHGYFVTKQPNQVQNKAGITNEQARKAEADFFTFQRPWCDFTQFRDRFGTKNIANKLAELLVDEIKKSIPRIRIQIRQHIEAIDIQLANIPPPTKHANLVILSIISRMDQLINQTMGSRYPNNQFWNEWKTMVGTLREALERMRPTLVVTTPQEFTNINMTGIVDLDSDNDVELSPRKRGKTTTTTQPQKKTKRSSSSRLGKRKFSLNDIRDILRTVSASGIPNSVDPSATDHIICDAMQDWGQPFEGFMAETEHSLQRHMSSLLDTELMPWQGTALDKEARTSVRDFVTGRIQFLLDQIRRMVDAELQKPMTFNEDALMNNKKKEWNILKDARKQIRAKEIIAQEEGSNSNTASKEMSDAARAAKVKKVTSEQLGQDPFANEIEVVADMRAYYTIASCSLVDGVCKMVQLELFQACRDTLAKHLRESLRLDDEDGPTNCERLLEENPERAAYREGLLRKRTTYLDAQQRLENAIRLV